MQARSRGLMVAVSTSSLFLFLWELHVDTSVKPPLHCCIWHLRSLSESFESHG